MKSIIKCIMIILLLNTINPVKAEGTENPSFLQKIQNNMHQITSWIKGKIGWNTNPSSVSSASPQSNSPASSTTCSTATHGRATNFGASSAMDDKKTLGTDLSKNKPTIQTKRGPIHAPKKDWSTVIAENRGPTFLLGLVAAISGSCLIALSQEKIKCVDHLGRVHKIQGPNRKIGKYIEAAGVISAIGGIGLIVASILCDKK